MILQLTHDFVVLSHVTNMNEWNDIQHIYELFYLKNSHEKVFSVYLRVTVTLLYEETVF